MSVVSSRSCAFLVVVGAIAMVSASASGQMGAMRGPKGNGMNGMSSDGPAAQRTVPEPRPALPSTATAPPPRVEARESEGVPRPSGPRALLITVATATAALGVYRLVLYGRARRAVTRFATEAILVVDLVESTRLATHYGEAVAMGGRLEIRTRALAAARNQRVSFTESTGDGVLMTFATVADAVATARLLRDALAASTDDDRPSLAMRAAITFGEILFDDRGGRHGATINRAFRIEGLVGSDLVHVDGELPPGELPDRGRILLGEDAAQEAVRAGIVAHPIGFAHLKGFPGLHRVFAVE